MKLDHGANIHEKDKAGQTPLHRAAKTGHADSMMLLLDHGANIDVQDNEGETPLHLVAERPNTYKVKCLLSAGADPQIANNDGKTARDKIKIRFTLSKSGEKNICPGPT